MSQKLGVTITDIKDAWKRIKPYVKHTPVHTSETLNHMSKRNLVFKLEVFQKGGSFKFRGACNSILSLNEDQAKRGVVTHSSGNHAQAVALAAKMRGVKARIVVPENAPKVKVAAIEEYKGEITFCKPTMDEREAVCADIQARTGATFIAPFNAEQTIAGQGTIAMEFLEQAPDLEAIVVPISGGGMISGIAIAAKHINPNIKIIAAEPVGLNDAPDVFLSKQAGNWIKDVEKTQTIADGLQARLGSLTWPIVRDLVDEVITVTESEIVEAMTLIYERMKVVVEPSGAVGLAAVLTDTMQERHKSDLSKVGIILCGGNTDFSAVDFWTNWQKKCQ